MKWLSLICFLILFSCQSFDKKSRREAIARVNKVYLYKEDIKDIVSKEVSKDDSISIVHNYINTWATKQLFIDQAKRNLEQDELNKYDDLVQDYKSTLYINAYKDAVISKSIDMEITQQDLEAFYNENIENFELQEDILRFRYLHLPNGQRKSIATQQKLVRYNDKDKEYFDSVKEEFKAFYFEDSTWVSYDQLLNKVPILQKRRKQEILQDKKFLSIRDTSGTFVVTVVEVLKPNETAPLSYIKSTIRQIILNQRKRKLIKKLEKDITKDAITNKQFEIYN